jgi:hypothetical protein
MTQVFDTHKFLYTLNYENDIKDLTVIFIDKTGEEKSIKLKEIDIGTSPISCTLIDEDNKKYRTPFLKIRKVLKNKTELIWDNTDVDLSKTKTIKAYK